MYKINLSTLVERPAMCIITFNTQSHSVTWSRVTAPCKFGVPAPPSSSRTFQLPWARPLARLRHALAGLGPKHAGATGTRRAVNSRSASLRAGTEAGTRWGSAQKSPAQKLQRRKLGLEPGLTLPYLRPSTATAYSTSVPLQMPSNMMANPSSTSPVSGLLVRLQ